MFSKLLWFHQDKMLFNILKNLRYGTVFLTMPNGSQHQFSAGLAGPNADLQIHTKEAVRRILSDGKIGFCEAFMMGMLAAIIYPN